MRKWECCLLEANDKDAHLHVYAPTGEVTTDLKQHGTLEEYQYSMRNLLRDAVTACITQLGQDGWELVSVVSDAPLARSMYFKRPVEGDAAPLNSM